MINRKHGMSHQEYKRTSINLYPTPTVYVNGEDDYDNPKVEEIWDWAYDLCKWAKEQYPLCNFEVITGIHDADYRVYAEVRITSPNGSHTEAAEWLEYKSI